MNNTIYTLEKILCSVFFHTYAELNYFTIKNAYNCIVIYCIILLFLFPLFNVKIKVALNIFELTRKSTERTWLSPRCYLFKARRCYLGGISLQCNNSFADIPHCLPCKCRKNVWASLLM